MPLVTPTRRKGKDVLGAVSRKPGVNPEGVMVCFVETVWRTGLSAAAVSSTRDRRPSRRSNGAG
jgi:hypothetical protein